MWPSISVPIIILLVNHTKAGLNYVSESLSTVDCMPAYRKNAALSYVSVAFSAFIMPGYHSMPGLSYAAAYICTYQYNAW